MAIHRTNILHKMVNVNFTIDEINMTLSVEPLHHFHDNGRGYFYIWSPRQRMGGDLNNQGLMKCLHKVTNSGVPGGNQGLPKPKYCIKVPSTGVHTIPIRQGDIGSPPSGGTPPFGAYITPQEHFSNKVVRGDHGWEAVAGRNWYWMYRYEWAEQGQEFVDTIISERGVGGMGSKHHRYTGWGHPIGKCGCYTYPVIQNDIGMNGETLVISDTTAYSVTCGGETKYKGANLLDPDNGVGDEYQEGISITRVEENKNGIFEYRNKWRMYYPESWPEKMVSTNFNDAVNEHPNYGHLNIWNIITGMPWGGGYGYYSFNSSNNIAGSAGAQYNVPWYNAYPERRNISQVDRGNTDAWNRIGEIENKTGVEFLSYRHSLIQRTILPTQQQAINPPQFTWEHVLIDQPGVRKSSTAFGRYPEPTQMVNGQSVTGWTLDTTALASTAVNIGIPVPANHPFAINHPSYGEFSSRIYGIVRKSSTLDVCGAPQVGPGNPDKGNPNWRNNLFDTEPTVNGPYNNYWGPHVHGVGGSGGSTDFGAAGPAAQQKNGGRGAISRFASNCARPWTGDADRSCAFVGNQSTIPSFWPDITHYGSRPDYTVNPANKYVGGESWKWDGYDSSGFTTTPTEPTNSLSWPSAWPINGVAKRNWIGHMNNASSPYWKNNYGIPIIWNNTHLQASAWVLDGTSHDANALNDDWNYGTVSNCGGGQCPSSKPNRFFLPSIKELDSPSYFNHIVTFEEEEDSDPDYGVGQPIHPLGYECLDCNGWGPGCMPVQQSNTNCPNALGLSSYPNLGPYNTFVQCHQQCNPYGTI